MAKTLVIKGADFSVHKLATVIFPDPIPCESISFDQNTYNLTTVDPVTIDYTVTPADTTDTIYWSSSNENVVTVANGIITVVGMGTATVTATCGEYTATATVTVNIAYIPNWWAWWVAQNGTTITSTESTARIIAIGSGNQATTYETAPTSASDPIKLIKIPSGATKVRVRIPNDKITLFANDTVMRIIWAKDEWSGDSNYRNSIKYVSQESTVNPRTNADKTYAIPEGVDGFVFITKLATMPETSGDANTLMAETGITISFLTE